MKMFTEKDVAENYVPRKEYDSLAAICQATQAEACALRRELAKLRLVTEQVEANKEE